MLLRKAKGESQTAPTKKRNERMDMVISESVIENALSIMKETPNIAIKNGDTTAYACLLFDALSVGGLNKKSQRDEAKGSFIQQIDAGHVAVLATKELMAMDLLIIIPTKETLDTIDEYGFMDDATFHWFVVESDGSYNIDDIGPSTDITRAHYLINGEVDIYEELASDKSGPIDNSSQLIIDDDVELIEEKSDTTGPVEQVNESSSVAQLFNDDNADTQEGPHVGHERIQEQADGALHHVEPHVTPTQGINEQPFEPANHSENIEPETTHVDQEADDDVIDIPVASQGTASDVVAQTEFSDSDVKEEVKRVFHNSDLDLTVQTNAFDMQFKHNNHPLSFEVNTGDGWLDAYMGYLQREANSELEKMHNRNIYRLQEMYIRLLHEHIENVDSMYSLRDDKTRFGHQYNQLLRKYNDDNADRDREIERIRSEIDEEYEAEKKRAGEKGYQKAVAVFETREQPAYQMRKAKVESEYDKRSNNEFDKVYTEFMKERKEDAWRTFDYGINAIIARLADDYQTFLDQENQVYQGWRARMQAYLEDNRKHDIARVKALEEKLQRDNIVTKTVQEYKERLEALKTDFELKEKDRQAHLQLMEENYRQMIESKDAEIETQKRLNSDHVREKDQEVQMWVQRCDKAKDDAHNEYRRRIENLENESASWENKFNESLRANKRYGGLAVALASVLSIATFAVGIIAGIYMSSGDDNNRTPDIKVVAPVQKEKKEPQPTTTITVTPEPQADDEGDGEDGTDNSDTSETNDDNDNSGE